MYLCQISNCICLKLQNVFVSNCKLYLSQIAKCICLKLQNVFVSNCKMYLSQIDYLVKGVAPVQGGKGLDPLAIAFGIVLQERPGVDIVGGSPEAWPLITVALPVHRRVPVPASTRVEIVFFSFQKLSHLCQEYLFTCSLICSNLSLDKRGSSRLRSWAHTFLKQGIIDLKTHDVKLIESTWQRNRCSMCDP